MVTEEEPDWDTLENESDWDELDQEELVEEILVEGEVD